MLWLAGDVKEPTRLWQRSVGHEVPGVVVWPLLLSEGWGGKCSEILATIKLLYNPRVNKVFISIQCDGNGKVKATANENLSHTGKTEQLEANKKSSKLILVTVKHNVLVWDHSGPEKRYHSV